MSIQHNNTHSLPFRSMALIRNSRLGVGIRYISIPVGISIAAQHAGQQVNHRAS